MARLNVKKKQAPRTITKGFRVSEAEAAALEEMAEREECDEAVIIRYALEQLPGWKTLVKRRQQALDAQPGE